jgi:hypothetical protein
MNELTALDVSIEDFTEEEHRLAEVAGVDLKLLVSNLRLTPDERIVRAQQAARMALMSGPIPRYDDEQVLIELELILALRKRRTQVGR